MAWRELSNILCIHLLVQQVKNLPAMQEIHEMQVQSLGQEDPLKKEIATRSSVLVWETPWTEETGRLQSLRSQKIWT